MNLSLPLIAFTLLVVSTSTQAIAVGPNDCDDPELCICFDTEGFSCGDNGDAPIAVFAQNKENSLNVTACIAASPSKPLCSSPIGEITLM